MSLPISINRFARLNFIFIGFIFSLSSLLFLCGARLNVVTTIAIVLFSVIGANISIKFKKDSLLLNSISVLSIILLILISRLYLDLTFDGQAYHQEMIIQIANGWNPAHEIIDKINNQNIWLNHYPKAYEIIAAVFYKLTHSIISVKFINLLLLGLSFLYPFIYFKNTGTKIKAFLIALIIAFNPIMLSQLMTNLIDGFLYAVTIITFFSYLLSRTKDSYQIDFVLGILLLINIKFTGLIFGIILFGVIILYNFIVYKANKINLLKKSLLILIISVPFLYAPYISNFVDKGHPFYPLMGSDNIDFVDYYVPDLMQGKDKINKFIISNFSSIGNRADAHIKIPFTFTLNELQKLRSGATRTGGFGVWWSGILLVSLIFYLWSIFNLKEKFKPSIYELIIGLIVLLMLLNKAGWWLRYTPFFWLTPLLLYLSINRYKVNIKFLKLLFILVIINGLLVLTVSLGLRYKDSKIFKNKLINLAHDKDTILVDFKSYLGNKALFDEFHVNYKIGNSNDFISPKKINEVVVIESKILK